MPNCAGLSRPLDPIGKRGEATAQLDKAAGHDDDDDETRQVQQHSLLPFSHSLVASIWVALTRLSLGN